SPVGSRPAPPTEIVAIHLCRFSPGVCSADHAGLDSAGNGWSTVDGWWAIGSWWPLRTRDGGDGRGGGGVAGGGAAVGFGSGGCRRISGVVVVVVAGGTGGVGRAADAADAEAGVRNGGRQGPLCVVGGDPGGEGVRWSAG